MGRHKRTGKRRAERHTIGAQELEPRLLLARVELVYEPDTSDASAFPSTGYQIVMNGQNAYFTAEASGGRELWTSDGTDAGTHEVKEIIPGTAGIVNNNIVPLGALTLFDANVKTGTTSMETWRTDGTEAGTYPLTYNTSNPWDFLLGLGTARVGNLMYGAVRNRDSGLYALGVTDGTTAGTRAISSTFSQNPNGIAAIDGVVYFAGSDSTAGQELWRSDGTPENTVRVMDIRPGTSGSSPSNLVAANHQLFFMADDGVTGREWWVTSPNGQTHEVADLRVGTTSVSVNGTAAIAGATPQDNGILLFYTAGIGSAGKSIWRSDGTSAGTYALKPVVGTVFQILSDGHRAYFLQGSTLWTSDGTAVGTVPVQTNAGFAPTVTDYGILGNKVLFRGSTSNQGAELWISDGSPVGTTLLKDIAPGAASSNPWRFASNLDGGRMFFAADANDGKGMELWATDGTANGTYAVKDINQVTPSSKPWGLTKVGDQAFYYVQQSGANHGLWKTDGTAGGTSRIADLYVEVDLFKKQQMAALGGRLFFSAQTPAAATGYELFMSDGSAAGTRLVKDIEAGTAGSSPRNMTVVGQELYFLAGSNYSLYRTNASGAEPELVASGVPDNLNTMAVVGDYLYYETGSPIAGDDLWRVKAGSPAEHVASMDIIEGIYNIHNRLIVQTRTVETSVSSLYESDGTAAGTREIAYLGFPHIAIAPLHETPFGAVFSAGPVTYATDLTTAGTRRIMNNKSLSSVRVYHGKTYLQIATAGNLGVTDGLYVTDGTEAGTKQLKSGYFYLENNETIDGRMYFEGFGYESNRFGLWESDGTADGTREVTSIVPGPIEGNAQPMVDLNRTLLMVADDHGDHGQEVWRVNPDVVAPVVQDVAFRPGDGARPAVKVVFSERVAASLTAASIKLTDASGQAVATGPVAISYDSASDTATFTFSAGLADGNYHLRVPAEMTSDPSGNVLAEARTLDFYVLGGDANGDRKVDFNDLVSLAQNYNTTGGKTWVDGDFTGDGNVDFNDLVVLAQRYNTSLAEPDGAAELAIAATSFASDWASATAAAPVVASVQPKKEQLEPVFSDRLVARPLAVKKPLPPRRR